MPELSAGVGPGTSELLQSLAVITVSFAVTAVGTYAFLARRFGRGLSEVVHADPDHLDEVMVERAQTIGLRLPVQRMGTGPVRVMFSDGSEVFYFERDLERYDRYVLGGLTSLDNSTVEDAPQPISSWTRPEKLRWLMEHPQQLDESDAR